MTLSRLFNLALLCLLISPPAWAMTANQAAHFLDQATYGATQADIDALVALDDYSAWIDAQIALPLSRRQEPYVRARAIELDGSGAIDSWVPSRHDIWWDMIVNDQDQLRHRMAYALSQIFVISERAPALGDSQFGMANYYDMLSRNAFGSFRTLLEDATLHPMMGLYLSMLRNEKENPAQNVRPDENYAREVMQLFTIGVHRLNLNGSVQMDGNNKPIPSYDENDIREFAQVFTGWNFANISWDRWWGIGDRTRAMTAVQSYHDTSSKVLLQNTTLPAGQSAEMDMQGALDNLFDHPNVGPFIARQLIQRFVTSNPTPAYVARVAAVFNRDGSGERGNLGAVIKAILLDDEAMYGAQNMPTTFGKLREPVMRLAHVLRAFKGQKVDGGEWNEYPGTMVYRFPYESAYELARVFGQTLLAAPSVFNFYLPDYSPPGVLQESQLAGPEFQISDENTQAASARLISAVVQRSELDVNHPVTLLNLSDTIAIAHTSLDNLLDHLDTVLCSGHLNSQTRAKIMQHLLDPSFAVPEGWSGAEWADYDKVEWQVRDAITLIINSPDYLVQR